MLPPYREDQREAAILARIALDTREVVLYEDAEARAKAAAAGRQVSGRAEYDALMERQRRIDDARAKGISRRAMR